MHSVKVWVNRKTFALKILLNRITTFQSLRIKKAVGQTLVKVFETENLPLDSLLFYSNRRMRENGRETAGREWSEIQLRRAECLWDGC